MDIIPHKKQKIQSADETPFDPSNCDVITSDDTQGAIEELCAAAAISASPGYTWGKSGNVTANSWLINDGVPSNKVGRNFALANGELDVISVSNEGNNTFSVELYEHDGTTFTLLATVSLTAQRSKVQTFTGVSVTQGKELATKVVGGSGKNVVTQCILRGTT